MADSNDGMLEEYKNQLYAVSASLAHGPPEQREELLRLKSNLVEVIYLLQGTYPEESEDQIGNPQCSSENGGEMDAEFARFQMEMAVLENVSESTESVPCNAGNEEESEEDEDENEPNDEEVSKVISSLEGSKCSAPFSQQWGEKYYHNAIISSVAYNPSDKTNIENFEVKVMFCNPTCNDMKPCPFFLDGHCKFPDSQCRYSHGNTITISEIRDFKLPDYSNFKRDSVCLAKYRDGLWYRAVVEMCIDDNRFAVKYSNFNNTETLDAEDLIPLGEIEESPESKPNDLSPSFELNFNDQVEEELQDVQPFLPQSSRLLGDWEQHTKGIGSKLMAKMGYIIGQGLGKNAEGRLDPVEAMILPKGKSLDKCIELRDQGNMKTCPISVEDKFIKEKERAEQRLKKQKWNNHHKRKKASVFDFLNEKISVIRDDINKLQHMGPPKNHKTRSSTKDLNKQCFSVAEDIRKTKRELGRLHESLKRNEERNGVIHGQVKRKIEVQKELLLSLYKKERKINCEMNALKTHEKLTIF